MKIPLSYRSGTLSLRKNLMKQLFSWLMVFCVLAGLNVRAIGADHSHLKPQYHAMDSCCGHQEEPAHPDDHEHHDGDCHHHHCCFHAQPLTVESDHFKRFAFLKSHRLHFRHEAELAPDEPFLGSEKPPLI